MVQKGGEEMVCNCSYPFTCPVHTPPKRQRDDLELQRMDTNHLINLLLISVFMKWQHDQDGVERPIRNDYHVGKQTHLVDLTEQRLLIHFLSPLKRILHKELEVCIQHFLEAMQVQHEVYRGNCQCDHVSKCYNAENSEKGSEEHHNNCLVISDILKAYKTTNHPSDSSKCEHCEDCTFTQTEAVESEFQQPPLEKQQQHVDIPEKIWLLDVLSLLHKEGFLHLDALFSKPESEFKEDSKSIKP